MNYEIEFLAVGNASKAGNAIIIRYGEGSDFHLMIVDGGHTETGQQIVDHIHNLYGRNAIIADVVLTHADGDHGCGLRTVLEELDVRRLWLNVPGLHAEAALPFFKDKRWTVDGLGQELYSQYELLGELVQIAHRRGATVHQPLVGEKIGPFYVLSPYKTIYTWLIPRFDRAPEPDPQAIKAAGGLWIRQAHSALSSLFEKALE